MTLNVWKSLAGTGAHDDAVYVENERADVHGMFAHHPKCLLDIGCARGNFGLGIKKAFGDDVFVWGVELNPMAADIAMTRLNKVSVHPVESFSSDEIELLKTVDTVMLLDVLEHMYNPWQALEFLAKHLSPEAQIIVSLPNVMNAAVMRDMAEGYFNYTSTGLLDVTHIRFFTPYEMLKMFYETGYRSESENYIVIGLGEDAAKCMNGPFPIWMQLDKIKIEVQSYNHWVQLNALQVYWRLRVADVAQLGESEHGLRFGEHPPTMTFNG